MIMDAGDPVPSALPTDVLQRIIQFIPFFALSNFRLASKLYLAVANTRVQQLHMKPTNTQIQSLAACSNSSLKYDHITRIIVSLPDDTTHLERPTSKARLSVVQQRQECLDTVTQFLHHSGPLMQHLSTLTISASLKTHLQLFGLLALPGWASLRHVTLTMTPAEGERKARKAKVLAEEASTVLRMLAQLPALQTLAMHGTSLDYAQLSTILPQLTSLNLSGQASGKAQLALPYLRKLKLSQQPLSPSAQKYPYRNLTALQHLALRYCTSAGQEEDSEVQEAALVDSLSQLCGLTQLQIAEKRHFLESAVEPLEWRGMSEVLCKMSALQRLSFLEWTIDNESLTYIAAGCRQLTQLGCLSIEGGSVCSPTGYTSNSSRPPLYPVLSGLRELVFGELDLASGQVPHMQRLTPELTALTLHGSLQLSRGLPAFISDTCAHGKLSSLAMQSHCFTKEVALACRAVARIELGFIWEAACDDSEEDWDNQGGGSDDEFGFDPEAFYDETGEYDIDAMYEHANEMAGMRAINNFAAICNPDYTRSANDVANGVHALAKGNIGSVQQPPSPCPPRRVLEMRVFGGMDDSTRQMEERSLVRMLRVLWRTGWKGEPGMTLVVRGLSDEDDCAEVRGLLTVILEDLPGSKQWAAVEWVDCQGLRQEHLTDLAECPGATRGLGIPVRVRGCSGVSERECDGVMASVVRPRVWGKFCVEWEAGMADELW